MKKNFGIIKKFYLKNAYKINSLLNRETRNIVLRLYVFIRSRIVDLIEKNRLHYYTKALFVTITSGGNVSGSAISSSSFIWVIILIFEWSKVKGGRSFHWLYKSILSFFLEGSALSPFRFNDFKMVVISLTEKFSIDFPVANKASASDFSWR